ncbi:MAG TPA: SGNH/GDSL hydrolase family protein [Anaerolineales bacterium]|nr:SGNH/GDSL hydrolase family protein [Anaerolineales bacterium]
MFYKFQYILCALLLSIVLLSCTSTPQAPTATSVPPIPTQGQSIFHLDGSALSSGIFETEATSLTIDITNTLPEQIADVSVEDGSGTTTYEILPGRSTIVHSISPAGNHVTITAGGQSKINGEIKGVFIDKITFNGPAVQVHPVNKQIVIYGDSLAGGGNVDHPSAEAWPVLLRKHYSVAVHAHGYRSLYDDASTPDGRSELVFQLSSQAPDYIWLAIGTNDYRFQLWSAQEFGEVYAATLNEIHSSNPQAILYAQSPIHRVNEGPNSLGNTLDDYRQQISDACLARSPWCIFVDGTASTFPQPDELAEDGVHLTTKSNVKYAEAVMGIIRK